MNDQWLIWCGTNAEQEAMARALGDDCVSIHGGTPLDEKIRLEERWRTGAVKCLITKPQVMGWGMNWQHCNRMIFVGLSDSYEAYYQCIRRCWRFGQARPVVAYVVLTEPEEAIYANVLRKERDAAAMSDELVKHVAEYERSELGQARQQVGYAPGVAMRLPEWLEGVAA